MGQKVNPHGLRVGVIKDWDSRWFAKDEDFGDTLVSDYQIRKYLKDKLKLAGIPKVEIERSNAGVKVFIHCAKPGMVIGRGGSEIEKLRAAIEKMTGKAVSVNVVEIKNPDINAQLVAEAISEQLEKRVAFRRAMRLGAKGIKISVSGRLGGAEIARSEHYHEGTIPLQTLRADIDYGFWEANTTYGKIGVKVWIYKGEVLSGRAGVQTEAPAERRERRDRRDRGDRKGAGRGDRGGRGDRRGGAPRQGGAGAPRESREGGRRNVVAKES